MGDRVVMHVHIRVVQVWQLVVSCIDGPVWNLHLADDEAARERSAVGVDPEVGDFHIMVKAVEVDTATALRTAGEAYAIDARWVAVEVVGIGCAIGSAAGDQNAPGGIQRVTNASSIGVLYSFAKDGNACTFVRPHECGFLQEFRYIAVEAGVPADHGFQRYPLHGILHRRITRGRACWIERV